MSFHVSRRRDGRNWTVAFCPHRSASFPGGAPALAKPFQQIPIHPASVAGDSLPDALRRLDLSRSRGASWRASRIAPGVGACERARLHDTVSFLATPRRPDHRSCGRRNDVPVARLAAPRAETSSRPRGCHRLGAGSGEHLLCTAHASLRTETAAVAALAEVGGCG
jgi:hypothetical protein